MTVFQNRRWDGDLLTVLRLIATADAIIGRLGLDPLVVDAKWQIANAVVAHG